MVAERPKRENAGNKMSKLLEEQEEEDEDDDFYKNTYGGFNEEEEDNDYQSEEQEDDIVDSDFSLSEREEEIENDEEDNGKRKRKTKKKIKVYGKRPATDGSPKVKKPHIKKVVERADPVDKQARMRTSTLLKAAEVAKRKNDQSTDQTIKRHPRMPQMRRLTQQELLAEAMITEEQNTASLAQFLKLAEEKKNVKVTKVRYQGPIVRFQSVRMPEIDILGEVSSENFFARNFIEFTDTSNFPRQYFPPHKVKYPEKPVCVVTGRPARYKDPVTGLPYATIEAFKYIRQHRKRLKEKINNAKNEKRKKRKLLST